MPNYQKTKRACYMGFITQAIAANFAPLLFLKFHTDYHISLGNIALISTCFFFTQLLVDLFCARFVDKIGYRVCIVTSEISSALGLVGLAFLPELLPDPFMGIIISVIVYAVGSGLIEVLCSPIMEACPFENKEATMSLLHSFYCWGSVGTIAVSTLFFAVFGMDSWKWLAVLWAIVPAVNVYNFATCPIEHLVDEGEGMKIRELFRKPVFWIAVCLMVCSGASELSMSQWASAYAEAALGLSKTIGDLAGPCMFAITMGISLLDCIDSDLNACLDKIYKKITESAKDLVKTGEEIAQEFGVPIVNKRISVTPIALVGGAACKTPEDFAKIAEVMDKAAHEVGVNFIGGYSALVNKGMTHADELLIRSIPMALSRTENVCSSVNVGSTRCGINMDAVRLLGEIIKETAEYTKEQDSLGCAKLVVFCNAPDDNPFMAGAFHGVTEADRIINVGVSGPGVVKTALESVRGESFEVLCETIKKTAFKVTRVGQLVAKEASKRLKVRYCRSFAGSDACNRRLCCRYFM